MFFFIYIRILKIVLYNIHNQLISHYLNLIFHDELLDHFQFTRFSSLHPFILENFTISLKFNII